MNAEQDEQSMSSAHPDEPRADAVWPSSTEDVDDDERLHRSREATRMNILDAMGNILFHALENNQSNGTSDYSYALNLFPLGIGFVPPAEYYQYPDQLPEALVCVDCLGWLPSDEMMRYLMMGYRVWDEYGRRLHFKGTALEYDGLKPPIRWPKKAVCTQDEREKPDLLVQLEVGDFGGEVGPWKNDEKTGESRRVMPWDITMRPPTLKLEGFSTLDAVKATWVVSRMEHTRSSYSRVGWEAPEDLGGWKLGKSALKDLEPLQGADRQPGPYPLIGVDEAILSIQYPPIQGRLKIADNSSTVTTDGPLCGLCATLDFRAIFEWDLDDLEIDFGTTDDLISREQCPFCRVLIVLCRDGLNYLARSNDGELPNRSRSSRFNFQQPIKAVLTRNPILCLSTKPFLVLTQDVEREYLGPVVSLRTVRGDMRGTFDIIDSLHVDFKVLSHMIEQCSKLHGDKCGSKTSGSLSANDNIILVDVEDMCLVEISWSNTQYMTLSYVWGQAPMLKTTQENFKRLQRPKSLLEAGISRLIKDAAVVVKELGLRYLWVDALCLIQDNKRCLSTMIGRMADIYGASTITIVAMTGENCDSPLPGVSQPRSRHIEIANGMPFTSSLSSLTYNSVGQIYQERGWTLQEYLVSRRRIVFTQEQVFFECGHGGSSDHEELFPSNDRGRHASPPNPMGKVMDGTNLSEANTISLSELEIFCDVVSQYSARKLTYQSDIENAFVGIQDVFTQKLDWMFIAGLPADVFDWSLLWFPHGQLERRRWTTEEDGVNHFMPPSWSWYGWQGQVSHACYTYHSKLFLEHIRPRVEQFRLCYGNETVNIHRKQSDIWHNDVIIDKSAASNHRSMSITSSGITLSSNLVLEFIAEVIPALSPEKKSFKLPIEWLNTGPSYGMLRHGLRHGYNNQVLDMATKLDTETLQLAAMATCDIQQTFRGGQFGEEKLFPVDDQLVVMLVHSTEDGLAERLAIGYINSATWADQSPTMKSIRLC